MIGPSSHELALSHLSSGGKGGFRSMNQDDDYNEYKQNIVVTAGPRKSNGVGGEAVTIGYKPNRENKYNNDTSYRFKQNSHNFSDFDNRYMP